MQSRFFTCLLIAWAMLAWLAPLPAFPADDDPHLNLGRIAAADEIAAWDVDVGPDGVGLPPGSGRPDEGAAVYASQCASCHGPEGRSGSPPLAGAASKRNTIGNYWPWATTLFDYIRRAMPAQSPGTLSDDEVYALTAHLLYLNGVIDADATIDAQSLPRIRMPARDRFVPDDRRGGAEVR